MDDMNNFGLLAQGYRCHAQLKAMINMNEFGSWALGSRCYEQLKVVDHMSYSGSWAQAMDSMNNLALWMIWTTSNPVRSGLQML